MSLASIQAFHEKCGKIWKNGRFYGRLWTDWGNTAWAAMAGLGSIGLCWSQVVYLSNTPYFEIYTSIQVMLNVSMHMYPQHLE